MNEHKGPLGFYNYTVILTYIGMWFGLCGIMFTMNGYLNIALICLMVAGVCDMFDGGIASTKKDRTRDERVFGIQIDSLSDLICFGVLPASIIYRLSDGMNFLVIIPCIFVLGGLIRLAFFNVDEANRQAREAGSRAFYLGLPITSSALAIPAVLEAGYIWKIPTYEVGLVVLLVIGVLYITPFKLKKPHLAGKLLLVAFGAVEFVYLIYYMVK